ncbi:MAG: laccase domain-containing protein [Deltaproteobacteria bacterium]|nr:laccase domain-containing protein [Deltaproteobacteria bacterium]
MIVKHISGVSVFQFPKLTGLADVRHGIFSRNTGESIGVYRSLNVSFDVGDDSRNVNQNRKIISRCIGEDDLVFIDQAHGTRVLNFKNESEVGMAVAADDFSQDSHAYIKNGKNDVYASGSSDKLVGDAMVSNIPGKFLAMQVADCQSVLMYEPVRQVIANVHAGWRGSIKNIVSLTIKTMERKFGCYSRNIVAGISPSLGPCCAQFVNYQKEIPAMYWKYKDDRDHFDFWSISRDQLCDAGVLIENIDVSQVCTKCDTGNFFSFRGEKNTGRFASVIGLA